MNFSDLQPGGSWAICETIGFVESYGCRFTHHTVAIGVKGYVKRNEFSPDWFQVLLRTERNAIVGFVISEKEAPSLIWVTGPAPASAKPDEHWSNYWRFYKQ